MPYRRSTPPRFAALLLGGLVAAAPADAITREALLSVEDVHEIELEFDFENWFDVLSDNKEDAIYVPGTFTIDGEVVDSVGVRFKGNSSYNHPGIKKPFRIKFGEYRGDQRLAGLPSIMLNNGFNDPTHIREAVTYEVLREIGYASETGFANVTVNGEFVGFYTIVETVGGTWVDNHFDAGEDGNLWEGERRAHLTWEGPDPTLYEDNFVLETNEEENDYSQLVDLIDRLNNTPIEALPDSLSPVLDVDSWLRHHAAHMAFVSLDSYEGPGHNFYVYRRDDQERFVHIVWDENLSFGTFHKNIDPPEGGDYTDMSAFWENPGNDRPLVTRILEVDLYRETYTRHMADLLATRWTQAGIDERIDRIADVVRSHVYADVNKQFSDAFFEDGLEDDVGSGRNFFYGLKSFVERRIDVLVPEIGALLDPQAIYINELMADNETTLSDEFEEYDDYAEIHNSGVSAASLEGYGLTDDHTDPFRWVLPPEAVVPAEGHLLLWLDGEPEQGSLHGSFSLDDVGEELFLFDEGGELVDFLCFDRQGGDAAWGRRTDGAAWKETIPASPGEPNVDALPPLIRDAGASRSFPAAGREVEVLTTVEETVADIDQVLMVFDAGSGFEQVIMEDQGGGAWSATLPGGDTGADIAYFVRAVDVDDRVSTLPAGAPEATFHCRPFVGRSAVTLNELMADNIATLQDEAGEFDDWIELANVSNFDVDLSGFYLSDDPDDLTQWSFPQGTVIGAGGYLLVWADGDDGDPGIHTNFGLSKSGEDLLLVGPSGSEVLDSVSFGAQDPDVSSARGADGLGTWSAVVATPESHNGVGGLVAVAVSDDDEVVIAATGGTFGLQASIFNRGFSTRSADAWTAGILEQGEREPLDGPLPIAVRSLDYVSAPLTVVVPRVLGPMTARYEVRVGEWGGTVESADGFPVTKLP